MIIKTMAAMCLMGGLTMVYGRYNYNSWGVIIYEFLDYPSIDIPI